MNLAVDRIVHPTLDQIKARVAPTVLAHEQTMPVSADLADLFAERALVRGRTLGCIGPAATSTAMALVAATVMAGSWLAVVDVPTFGLDAANEAGIPLERVVAITTGITTGVDPGTTGTASRVPADWVDVMAAAVDGFDIVLSRQPSQLEHAQVTESSLRRLSTRIRQRGAVVLLLDDDEKRADMKRDDMSCADMKCDGVIETSGISWSGLGSGYGHLQQRTLDLSASGRRLPGRRLCNLTVRGDVCA
jgi:hypothetical protein